MDFPSKCFKRFEIKRKYVGFMIRIRKNLHLRENLSKKSDGAVSTFQTVKKVVTFFQTKTKSASKLKPISNRFTISIPSYLGLSDSFCLLDIIALSLESTTLVDSL